MLESCIILFKLYFSPIYCKQIFLIKENRRSSYNSTMLCICVWEEIRSGNKLPECFMRHNVSTLHLYLQVHFAIHTSNVSREPLCSLGIQFSGSRKLLKFFNDLVLCYWTTKNKHPMLYLDVEWVSCTIMSIIFTEINQNWTMYYYLLFLLVAGNLYYLKAMVTSSLIFHRVFHSYQNIPASVLIFWCFVYHRKLQEE